jgi:ribonuclease P protein component
VAFATLKKRPEFLRLRGGARCATASFVLETKPQSDKTLSPPGPRFGLTITKALGGAVIRNRIRRRLRAALADVEAANARANHDYVVIARAKALNQPFPALKKDLERAFHRVHHPTATKGEGKRRR